MKTRFDPRAQRRALRLITAGSLLCLSACGGGGGGGSEVAAVVPGGGGGIGGTGLTSSGTVDGTGSIFVNGVRFDVDDADIFVNGEPAGEAELGLGMVVTVSGRVDDDGVNGTAERVDYDAELKGPISSLERNADNSSARLIVLSQVVIAERTSTVFEDTAFDLLSVGNLVEISGYRDNEDRLRATRIEGENDIETEVSITGTIGALQGQSFRIGDQPVDATDAQLEDLPASGLANGLRVEVEGELRDGVIAASRIEGKDELSTTLQPDDQVVALGAISDLDGSGGFRVRGLPVDAANSAISSGGLPLKNGLIFEVSGTWDGAAIVADAVTVRRGRIQLEAPLSGLDAADGTLSFQYGTEEVSVATDSRTLFDDDRDDIEYLQISDLAVGDYLEVEALDVGGSLLATRVDRDETDDENELQAPVESFVDGISVTLLGVTFDVTQAEFENAGDDDISAGEFFANLSIGALVSVSDDAPGDGFAESVEFEFALSLDGDRDFIDDDEERIPESELPENARAFLEANYPGRTIAFIERDDDEIEVYLTDGTEIVFSLSGTFLEADEDDDSADDESPEDNDDDSDADEGDDSGNDEDSDDGEGDEDDESDEEDAEDSEDEESEEDLDDEADEADEADDESDEEEDQG
jgi:hypothetical protein